MPDPPPIHSVSALARCVGDAGRFARDHWGTHPLHRHRAGAFCDLLDLEAIEQLLADGLRAPAFRLVRDGKPLSPSDYTRTVRIGGRSVNDVADVDRIAIAIGSGASLVMQSLERYWPPLNAFCTDLQRELSHPVQANAYLSPPGAAALKRHRDRHDVLVLQLEGTKAWDVDGIGVVALVPGDVLYLPAATAHAATTHVALSLHVTIGILSLTARDVVRHLVETTGGWLDAPLPIGFARDGSTDLRAAISDVRDRFVEHLGTIDPSAVAIDVRRDAARRCAGRDRVIGRLRVAIAPGSVDAATPLTRRPGPVVVADLDDQVIVEFGRTRLRLPGFTRSAARFIAEHGDFRAADLPGLDDASAVVLVARLVREGLLLIDDPSSASPRPARRPRSG